MTEQTELQLPPHGCKWVNCIDGTTERMRLTAKNLLVIEAFNGAHWTLVTYSLDIILPRIYMLWRDEVERRRDEVERLELLVFNHAGKWGDYCDLSRKRLHAVSQLAAVEAAWAALKGAK